MPVFVKYQAFFILQKLKMFYNDLKGF